MESLAWVTGVREDPDGTHVSLPHGLWTNTAEPARVALLLCVLGNKLLPKRVVFFTEQFYQRQQQ